MFPRCTNINYYVPIRFYLCVAGFTENSLAMRTRQEQQRGTIASPLAMLGTTYSTISTLPILVIPATASEALAKTLRMLTRRRLA